MNKLFKDFNNPKLAEAVYNQIYGTKEPTQAGIDDFLRILNEVLQHGGDSGITGFIYYNDLFWKKNRKIIIDALIEYSEKIEQDIFEYIKHWSYFKDDPVSSIEIAEALFGKFNPNKFMYIYSTFAWFAIEEVAFGI